MSFRQFPAVTADGQDRVILEFQDESSSDPSAAPSSKRYELDDGRHLERNGREFTTVGGELRLTLP